MSLFLAQRNRTATRDITILDVNENVITPRSTDKIRARICREGDEDNAKLTVASDALTANGSTFTKGATNRLRLDSADLSFPSGVYSLIIDLWDHADTGGTWKTIDRQVLSLQE